jgi:hypothetical protein
MRDTGPVLVGYTDQKSCLRCEGEKRSQVSEGDQLLAVGEDNVSLKCERVRSSGCDEHLEEATAQQSKR